MLLSVGWLARIRRNPEFNHLPGSYRTQEISGDEGNPLDLA
jgi:hypothetical protein